MKRWNDHPALLTGSHNISMLHRYTALMLGLFITFTTNSSSYGTPTYWRVCLSFHIAYSRNYPPHLGPAAVEDSDADVSVH
jgi:hypothetical protein